MKIRVYRNLTRKCWSLQHYVKGKGWRVYSHWNSENDGNYILEDCKFIIYKSGQDRVRKEGKKYVHAYIEGNTIQHKPINEIIPFLPIRYNPYSDDCFNVPGWGNLETAKYVIFYDSQVWTGVN